jgi:hypothetical protein
MTHCLDEYTFILVDRKPVQHANDDDWFRWFMVEENRRVALTRLPGGAVVSTVFSGMALTPDGLLFETKVFSNDGEGGDEWRTATWEAAEQKHIEVVRMLTK